MTCPTVIGSSLTCLNVAEMLGGMEQDHPGRSALTDAITLCNRIALREVPADEKQAAIWHGLRRSIEDIPAILTKRGPEYRRDYIDSIDIQDVPNSGVAGVPSQHTLSCTLFLFTDMVLLAKRPSASAMTGKALAGLDDIDRLAAELQKADGQSVGLTYGLAGVAKPESKQSTPSKIKKGSMTFKGAFDVHDIVTATRSPTADAFDIFLNIPPTGFSERWSGRPHRHYVVQTPGLSGNQSFVKAKADCARFLENLRRAQALVKASEFPAMHTMMTPDGPGELIRLSELPPGNEVVECVWNLYDKKAYLQEKRKVRRTSRRQVLELTVSDAAPSGSPARR